MARFIVELEGFNGGKWQHASVERTDAENREDAVRIVESNHSGLRSSCVYTEEEWAMYGGEW